MNVILVIGSPRQKNSTSAALGDYLVKQLEAVIVTIQVMRLQYFEGFSRYFSADGREFTPLRLRRKPRAA